MTLLHVIIGEHKLSDIIRCTLFRMIKQPLSRKAREVQGMKSTISLDENVSIISPYLFNETQVCFFNEIFEI